MRRAALLACLLLIAAPGCAAWKRCAYESSDRDAWQKPEAVVADLGIRAGDQVADLGSGSGYFTVRLARAVGPDGRVYAVDVDEEMNEYLRGRLAEEGIDNVEVVLGDYDDPKLPDGRIDLLFTSNTYHHIQDRSEYFRRVRADLAPGGRVAVIEYDGRKGLFVKWMGHYTGKQEILSEMEAAGYRLAQDVDGLDRQSFLIFRPE
jgi:arsenite methyltransferase